MGLHFMKLTLKDFRNLPDLELALGPDLTILLGPNATGKTNTAEALQLLTAGTSFRRARPQELISMGSQSARVSGVLTGDDRYVDVSCSITPRKKTFKFQGKPVKSQQMAEGMPSILFCPDDLGFVKGAASVRRRELDFFASEMSPSYERLLSGYTRTLEQRNKLLKQSSSDMSLLDAWDASLARGGAALIVARKNLLLRLFPKVSQIYGKIGGGEVLECNYLSSTLEMAEEAGLEQPSRDELAGILYEQLAQMRIADLYRQQTQVGPHRDDVSFTIDSMDARTFASQGQQRSVVLSWKMAEVLLCEEILDRKPLLLLDDVMSELDASRRKAITAFMEDGIQAVITTTNLEYFSEDLLGKAKVIHYA